MTEAAFAKTFLSNLDGRPIRLPPDHVEDPKNLPGRTPYILPKMPKAMSKPQSLAPGQERSITVTLKSLRNPPLDIKLSSQLLNTSVMDIKSAVSEQARIPVDKMKLLHNKKPVPDSKVLRDLVKDGDTSIEFSVMVIGGAAAVQSAEIPVAATPAGTEVLETDAFWADLKGFLLQRIKDEKQADELSTLFRSSWQAKR